MIHDSLEIEINADWIARFHAGDETVFEQLYSRYTTDLSAYFAARRVNRTSVDDLLQMVWLKVWKYRSSFQHGNFRAWMYRIAANELISQWRRKYPELLSENFDPAEPAFDQEDERLSALRECLEAVEGIFVEVVRGRIRGLSTEELAQHHKISSKAVATRIYRGKQLLRECVEGKNK